MAILQHCSSNKYMSRIFVISAILLTLSACQLGNNPETRPEPAVDPSPEQFFAKGADISWATEMESRGYTFRNREGKEMECTALMKELGMNTVRLRVWVNPTAGWCAKEDVLTKARRAQDLGMRIMIDFHYSDWWADPGKQNVPEAWKEFDADRMAQAVESHTSEVLQYLKDAGIDVTWVQVGNEVENGMLWESGRVSGQKADTFIKYFNAGARAVKEIYENAYVILHTSNSWNAGTLTWFYDLMRTGGADYDIIGLSLYPSYWENGAYPDWKAKTEKAVNNFKMLHERYSKPVILVEFGMPNALPEASRDCLEYILDNTVGYEWFKGVILWEPEAEKSVFNYEYGAFSNGMPTVALDPFKTHQI